MTTLQGVFGNIGASAQREFGAVGNTIVRDARVITAAGERAVPPYVATISEVMAGGLLAPFIVSPAQFSKAVSNLPRLPGELPVLGGQIASTVSKSVGSVGHTIESMGSSIATSIKGAVTTVESSFGSGLKALTGALPEIGIIALGIIVLLVYVNAKGGGY